MGIDGGDDKDVYERTQHIVKPVPCGVCDQLIEARTAIRAMDKHFHHHCFKCAKCSKSITSQVFTILDDNRTLVCGFCGQLDETGASAASAKPQCKVCRMPVSEGVKVQGHSFHRGCFKCSRCDRQPTGSRIALDKEGLPVCETCIKNKTPPPATTTSGSGTNGGGNSGNDGLDDLEKLHDVSEILICV